MCRGARRRERHSDNDVMLDAERRDRAFVRCGPQQLVRGHARDMAELHRLATCKDRNRILVLAPFAVPTFASTFTPDANGQGVGAGPTRIDHG